MRKRKKVAFVCVHNSCRSQIAEALGKRYTSENYEFCSAGTEIESEINQDAVRLIKHLYDIDMEATQYPKLIEDIPAVDIVITMGCNVHCPTIKCESREDWDLDDPSGKSDEEFLRVIQAIENNIKNKFTIR